MTRHWSGGTKQTGWNFQTQRFGGRAPGAGTPSLGRCAAAWGWCVWQCQRRLFPPVLDKTAIWGWLLLLLLEPAAVGGGVAAGRCRGDAGCEAGCWGVALNNWPRTGWLITFLLMSAPCWRSRPAVAWGKGGSELQTQSPKAQGTKIGLRQESGLDDWNKEEERRNTVSVFYPRVK